MAFAGEINYRKRGLSIGLALVLVIFVMATFGAPTRLRRNHKLRAMPRYDLQQCLDRFKRQRIV